MRRVGLLVGLVVLGVMIGSAAAVASTTINGSLATGDQPYAYMGTAGPSSCTQGSPYGYSGGATVSDWYKFTNTTSKYQCVDVRLTPGGFCTTINSFSVDDPGYVSLGESGATSGPQHYSYWAYPGETFDVVVSGVPSGLGCTYTLRVQIGRLGPAVVSTGAAGSALAPARP